MVGRDIVVVGGSAGSIEAVSELVRGLPQGFAGSLFVVVHFPGSVHSTLPRILGRAGPLPASHATDGERIEPGRIYVAQPDCHLLLNDGRVSLTHGPKENGHRPAVDPLFRTAAHSYGSRVIGVVLSGNLNDGTAGLLTIKQRGGMAIAQSLDTALYPGMPRSAIEHVAVDHVLSPPEIARLITELVRQPIPSLEVLPLSEEVVRFRCRVGHTYSDEALLVHQAEQLEAALWTALRALEEHSALAKRLATRASQRGHIHSASVFTEQFMDAEQHATVIRDVLQEGIRTGSAADVAAVSN